MELKLRPHQDWQRHAVMEAWKAGHRSVCLASPTGSGKRYLALWFMQFAHEHGRRTLFVGNRRLLISQAYDDAAKFSIPHGVIMSDTMVGSPGATNQIASIQTLESWYFNDKDTGELSGDGLPDADLVIVDEAHGDLRRIGVLLALYPRSKFLLLTATPVGPDGRSLVPDPYDVLVEVPEARNVELIGQELLLPTTVYAPSEPDIDGVKIVNRQEYNQQTLGKRVQECTVFADVFQEWSMFADRATVIFVPRVAFGHDLAEQFNAHLGPGTFHVIHAKTKQRDRDAAFDAVESGAAKGLISCDVLREGFDLPVLSCGIDLQPNAQLRSFWQKVGRVKRPFPGQTEAVWLDFAGNYWKFPNPNDNPEWPQGEETTQDVIRRQREAGKEPQPVMCPKCGLVRNGGPKCPGCGHEAPEPIRRVRMGNGKLKEIPASEKKKREKTEAEKQFSKWQGKLYAALNANLTFGQAAHLFHGETGERPREGWPGVFPSGDLRWKRRLREDFDPKRLAIACSTAKRSLR